MPRGGFRPGAGRKPLTPEEKAKRKAAASARAAVRAAERAAERGRVLTPQVWAALPLPPAHELPPIEAFEAPDSLTSEERQIWVTQAPFAFENRTLTKASALAFERYCRMVAKEVIESKSSAAEGPNHRGLRREINALEFQFRLTPNGRPMVEPAGAVQTQPMSALAKFRS
jgi:hypothetical protein